MEIKFGLRIPCSDPAREVARMAAETEAAGFDIVWQLDSQLLNREAWVVMTASAMMTKSIVIGLNVTNPITRHASVTASAASTLEEMIPGRFILGIGAGDSSVRLMGIKRATLDQLRQAISLIRRFQSGDLVDFDGHAVRMKSAEGSRRTPIYLSATGPRMLELAGEVADGVILLAGLAEQCHSWVAKHLAVGADRAGRRLEDIHVVCGTFCYPSESYADAVEHIRPIAASFMIDHTPILNIANVPIPKNIDMSGLYPDVSHAENWDLAIEKTQKWLPFDVAAEFGEKFCLLGTPQMIADRLKQVAARGFTSDFYIRGHSTYQYPTRVAEAFKEVIPLVRRG